MAIPGFNPSVVDSVLTTETNNNQSNSSVGNNRGLFGEDNNTPNFGDFNFNEYEEHSLDSPLYRYHKKQYETMKQKYNNDLSFSRYMALTNIGIDNTLQHFENLMETDDFRFGEGIAKNKLDKDRKAANPENQNEEVYWNIDKSKFYLLNWDKGTYKTVDPKDLPWLPKEELINPPEVKGDGDIPVNEEKTGDTAPSEGDDNGTEETEESDDTANWDPIGYTSRDGSRFDFVVDRNKDNIFNGPQEFLGALKNWSEMEALDKDSNGIVEGSELAGLLLLKTGTDGVQSFINAIAMNLKIYLDSYKKKDNSESVDGQKIVGEYTIFANGETRRGYNTIDTLDYLNREYGNVFNKKIV